MVPVALSVVARDVPNCYTGCMYLRHMPMAGVEAGSPRREYHGQQWARRTKRDPATTPPPQHHLSHRDPRLCGPCDLAMGFVYIAATVCVLFMDAGTCHLTQTVWAPLIWAVACGLLAACWMATGVITGLILCVRPAVFNTQSSVLYIQHWPRRAGLTLVWAGLGIMMISAFVGLQPPDFTSTAPPDERSITGRVYLAFFIIFGPLFGLGVLESLVRRFARRRAS